MSEDVEYGDNGQFVMMDYHELNNDPNNDDIASDLQDYVEEVIRELCPPQPIVDDYLRLSFVNLEKELSTEPVQSL